MRVVVIGSGLCGITAAYFLTCRGHQVTVLERQPGPALETSFANGSLLTPSMPEPWNAPGCWRALLTSIGRSDAALQLRLRALPALVPWGIEFLRKSRPADYERSALKNLRLTLYSLQVMSTLRQQTGIEYGRTARGTMKISREPVALDRATAAAERFAPHGLSYQRLSPQEVMDLEPTLAPIAKGLAGAIHYPTDETGDAHRFCVALAELARARGAEFRFRTAVTALEVRSGLITAAVADSERISADRYVLAAGSYGTPLLRSIGLTLPVRPAKGYSVTLGRGRAMSLPQIPIVDDDLHAAVVPFDGGIRVAGTAEFAGYDLALRPARIANLLALLRQLLPDVKFDPSDAKPWCGLRPMSVDGVPIIGPTGIPNLFMNTGHGHLGWTMAAGSGRLLCDLVCGDIPEIDPMPYAFARFDRVGRREVVA